MSHLPFERGRTFASLSGLILLLLLISQCITYFNYRELPTVAAVDLADITVFAVWFALGRPMGPGIPRQPLNGRVMRSLA